MHSMVMVMLFHFITIHMGSGTTTPTLFLTHKSILVHIAQSRFSPAFFCYEKGKGKDSANAWKSLCLQLPARSQFYLFHRMFVFILLQLDIRDLSHAIHLLPRTWHLYLQALHPQLLITYMCVCVVNIQRKRYRLITIFLRIIEYDFKFSIITGNISYLLNFLLSYINIIIFVDIMPLAQLDRRIRSLPMVSDIKHTILAYHNIKKYISNIDNTDTDVIETIILDISKSDMILTTCISTN